MISALCPSEAHRRPIVGRAVDAVFVLFILIAFAWVAGRLSICIVRAALAVFRFLDLRDDSKIVLCVLHIVFRHHAITRRRRIAGQRQVFLVNLPSVASDPNVRAVAVEGLMPQRYILPPVVAPAA